MACRVPELERSPERVRTELKPEQLIPDVPPDTDGKRGAQPWGNAWTRTTPDDVGAGRRGVATSRPENFVRSGRWGPRTAQRPSPDPRFRSTPYRPAGAPARSPSRPRNPQTHGLSRRRLGLHLPCWQVPGWWRLRQPRPPDDAESRRPRLANAGRVCGCRKVQCPLWRIKRLPHGPSPRLLKTWPPLLAPTQVLAGERGPMA